MGVDAEELILRSFRDVIERGNDTVTNAETNGSNSNVERETLADMGKAGRALVREGERALKRLQPLWDGQVEKYGDAFKDALLQLDNIERRRRDLEDLLYDFEDYTVPACFDPAKFADLQAATRSFALDVISSTKRLKLGSPKRTTAAAPLVTASSSAQYTSSNEGDGKTSSFPPLPPLPTPMAIVPPSWPTPRLMSLPAKGDLERRPRLSRSSLARGSDLTVPRSPSLTSAPAANSHSRIMASNAAEIADNDEPLVDSAAHGSPRTAPTDLPSLYSMPSNQTLSSRVSLHRASTRSTQCTSMSGASSKGARDYDFVKRYQLYDHPEIQDQRLPDLDEGLNRAAVAPDLHARLPPSIPRTSAWVRSHQQYQQQQLQRLRPKAIRDHVPTYGNDCPPNSAGYEEPVLLSRSSSFTVDDCARSATTATALSSASTVYSLPDGSIPAMKSKLQASNPMSAPNYTSSPVLVCSSPPLSPTDTNEYTIGTGGMDSELAMPPLHGPAAASDPSLVVAPNQMSAESIPPLQSIQDFVRFAPSPPVPAMRFSLLPKELIGKLQPDDDTLASNYAVDEAPARNPESQEREDQACQRPYSPLVNSGTQLDTSVRADHVHQTERPASRSAHWSLTPKVPPVTYKLNASAAALCPVSPSALPGKPREPGEKHFDHGLMVVEDEDQLTAEMRATTLAATDDGASDDKMTADLPHKRNFVRESDCSIGPKSTFERMGGFCNGALLYRTGGHWTAIKQQGGYVANKQASIGRCVSCGYGHNYEEVRLDMDRKPEATFTKANGVRFRLRLLYKSHIGNNTSSQRQPESHYACVFCVHSGASAREGDATVFTTPEHLLLHIARHPQPLPVVPGITVLYGSQPGSSGLTSGGHLSSAMSSVSTGSNTADANDFDLHLVNPPLPTPVPPAISQSAVATASCEHVQRYGGKKLARPPHYGGDMLHFLAGARIVSVMFPEQWEGKWCMGWHDGFVGAFPAKCVQVEPPRQNEIPMASSDSGMSVTARWKWKPGEGRQEATEKKTGRTSKFKSQAESEAASVWLSFEKGETIFNVRCLYADHWCWAGTNSKGRFGVFPQSHIITRTLQQEMLAPSRPVKSSWSTRSLFRGTSGSGSCRPPSSSAVSSTSNSTGRTRFR
ncbi:hypothetical protein SEPCBS119000_004254 [Sporothrix epigloea]|uniref:Sh3 domain containing protein n=1 Tax=Sporothrix epigloea TaxID=1892477 RepID=A0ABP0DV60_9PEZI